MDLRLRAAVDEDREFLMAMLVEGVNWTGQERLTAAEIVADPHLWRYVDGWLQPGDFGLVALGHSGQPAGAVWCRLFLETEQGYGFVSADIPEVSLAVRPDHRGMGVGTALLSAVMDQARDLGFSQLSLSVEDGNAARRLYERCGFITVDRVRASDTMVCAL